MTDTTLNRFVASGTAADLGSFTPSPPTPASGPDPGYFFYVTDLGEIKVWNGAAWVSATKRVIQVVVSDPNGDAITTGDGKAYLRINAVLNGYNLIAVAAHVTTVSSGGDPTIQIANVTQAADMLSTKITIDAGEKDSKDATTPAVIDTGNDDVATGDELRIDIDVAGTGAKGLIVDLTFAGP